MYAQGSGTRRETPSFRKQAYTLAQLYVCTRVCGNNGATSARHRHCRCRCLTVAGTPALTHMQRMHACKVTVYISTAALALAAREVVVDYHLQVLGGSNFSARCIVTWVRFGVHVDHLAVTLVLEQ